MKELIGQVFKVTCPISLRIKYWLRAYTLETKFYKDMNSDLMKDKIKIYIPFIQLLYSGLKLNNFNFSYTKDLYRGALIDIKELENIMNHKEKNKKTNNPCGLIYSKAFMSFSLDKKVALDFMLNKIPTEKQVRVLYILKSEVQDKYEQILIYKNATNADLKDISYFEEEREILLFPFSIYEISDVDKEENYYIIYLNILGKYKQYFKYKKQSDLIEAIYQSKYVKMLQSKGLLTTLYNLNNIVLHFLSTSEDVQFSWVCNFTDIFSNIEEILYHNYPRLKNKVFFLANGNTINRSITLEQNGLKDDDVILIVSIDF